MAFTLLITAAAASMLVQGGPLAEPEAKVENPLSGDPLIGEFFHDEPIADALAAKSGDKIEELLKSEGTQAIYRQLYAQVRQDRRDPAWSERTEAGLRENYGAERTVRKQRMPVRVICSASLCEITVRTSADAPAAVEKAFYEELQSTRLVETNMKLGLKHLSTLMGAPKDGSHLYLSYWRRNAATGAEKNNASGNARPS